MKPPRNQQRVIVKSLQDLGVLTSVSGTDPQVPVAQLDALAVLDSDSITDVSQDSHGNISVKVSTSDALHPALQKDSTMTITTGPGRVHQPSTLTATTNVTPFPSQPSTQESNTTMQTANNTTAASNNTAALDTRDQAQGVVRADISNDLRPDDASTAAAAPTKPAKRARRMFRAEPEGNFEESYQAGLDMQNQLTSLRARVAHHSNVLAQHDGEIDDLNARFDDLNKTVEENAKIVAANKGSSYAREEKNFGYYAEQAGSMAMIGGGMMLGIGAVAIASDYFFGTNLATAPTNNGN